MNKINNNVNYYCNDIRIILRNKGIVQEENTILHPFLIA